MRVNLCGILDGFYNIDLSWKADKRVDLEKKGIPLKDNSVDILICMSAINYFTKQRGQFIINEVHRVLKPNGICRFGVQDLETICMQYLLFNPDFNCERINRWFNSPSTDGYNSNGKRNKYVYDYKELSELFNGFLISPKLQYQEDWFGNLGKYDNRPEQMFFIEGKK